MEPSLSLYMLLLGSKPPGRHIEQHDVFFGIATAVSELVPLLKRFWPEAGNTLHADGWRKIQQVDGYAIRVSRKAGTVPPAAGPRLFFINLGGYQRDKLEEQHYQVLSVQHDKTAAVKQAMQTLFYKTNTIKGGSANSHIDDKYGIDVDDIYEIEDMLMPEQKEQYELLLTPTENETPDPVQLGYYRMDKLLKVKG